MFQRRSHTARMLLVLAGTCALIACGSSAPKGEAANRGATPVAAAGVNSYLWRASLDTLSFLPLASEDPFGGVIISEWYSPPESPNERFKVDIYILDKQLNAEALKATVFHQVRAPGGDWSDAVVDARTAGDLENQILTRARQMRIASTNAATQR